MKHNNPFKDLKKSKSLNFINSIVESKRISDTIDITNNNPNSDDELFKKFSLTRTINHENDSIELSISKDLNVNTNHNNWMRNFKESNLNNFHTYKHGVTNTVYFTSSTICSSSSSSSLLGFSFCGDSIRDFTVRHKHPLVVNKQATHCTTQTRHINFFNMNKKSDNNNKNFKNRFHNWLLSFNHQHIIDNSNNSNIDNDTIYYNTCGSSIYS